MKWMIQANKSDLINKSADELMKVKELSPPEWATYVRTGANKERAPVDKNWWYKRAASLLLKAADKGPIGVSKLRTEYGGKKRRGHKPAEFRRASGNILRKIMQQLEKAEMLKQVVKGVHKGRIVTPKGMSFLNTVAKTLAKKKPVPKAAPKVEAESAPVKAPKPAETKAKPVGKIEAVKQEKKAEPKPAQKEENVEAKNVKPEAKPAQKEEKVEAKKVDDKQEAKPEPKE